MLGAVIAGVVFATHYYKRQSIVVHTDTTGPQSASFFAMSDHFETFKKPSSEILRDSLTELQYYVTQESGTEKPFENAYWDNHADGIYVDLISGEPLFSSRDKFDSGTGWPSFLKPIDAGVVTESDDSRLGFTRTEIRSRYGDNHIGHIIMDGPLDNSGIRYCMNSASMRFIPVAKFQDEGYGRYSDLFELL